MSLAKMQIEDLFTIFGKENVKVLTDDPEYKKVVDESRVRINREMEEYRDSLPIQSKYRSFP